MQNHKYIFLLFIVATICACDLHLIPENKYLGKLPGIAARYKHEINQLKNEAEATDDLNKAYKLMKHAEKKEKQANREIEQNWELMSKPVNLAFEQKSMGEFEITGLKISEAKYNYLVLVATAIIKKGNTRLFANIVAIDKNGKTLGESSVLISERNPKKGKECSFYGSLKNLDQLSNFRKIRFFKKQKP